MNECPAYLEIIHSGFKQEVSIKGMGKDYFNQKLLKPILEARELWYGVFDMKRFDVEYGFAALSADTRGKYDEFLRAAESLGADRQSNAAFAILNLYNRLENRRGILLPYSYMFSMAF
jgi:hypothetical protein